MEGTGMSDAHLTSAAAFVEGGIQDAFDDACSICLEAFCDSNPSTVTVCKHEYHLQCILEWCQRSSQCPMCLQPVALKDPTSQELLEAEERERSFRFNSSRNATIFHHPTLGDFELQHFPADVTNAELEERIIQHLAAAAAMGRRQLARREGQRHRSSGQGRHQFVVFRDPHESLSTTSSPASSISIAPPPSPNNHVNDSPNPASLLPYILSTNRVSSDRVPPNHVDRAGPSEFQSFSDSLRSKLNAVSMKYKESIAKGTRGWKEKLFSKSPTVADISSEVRREVNAGIATVSRLMERLEAKDKSGNVTSSVSNNMVDSNSNTESNNERSEGSHLHSHTVYVGPSSSSDSTLNDA